ncbi:hypothetical protein AtubIFM56815_004954 [Aspergillus tubingensis]|uniref:LysM domain-containing protein n=1 Tax=Aspergillus tubingensis TaxID=5068 RepID=A0A9W6AF59_ASPTU|nr:hypothetical protein AtubIFM56815_004954 [Aspergillus tubingensis]
MTRPTWGNRSTGVKPMPVEWIVVSRSSYRPNTSPKDAVFIPREMQLKYLTIAGLAPGVACALSKRTTECSFTTDASKGDTCDSLADAWGLSVEGLQHLNPGITCPDPDTTKS